MEKYCFLELYVDTEFFMSKASRFFSIYILAVLYIPLILWQKIAYIYYQSKRIVL